MYGQCKRTPTMQSFSQAKVTVSRSNAAGLHTYPTVRAAEKTDPGSLFVLWSFGTCHYQMSHSLSKKPGECSVYYCARYISFSHSHYWLWVSRQLHLLRNSASHSKSQGTESKKASKLNPSLGNHYASSCWFHHSDSGCASPRGNSSSGSGEFYNGHHTKVTVVYTTSS